MKEKTSESQSKPTIFLSYSHADEAWADRLVSQLKTSKAEGKLEIWHDKKIEPGENWAAQVSQAIQSSELAILLVSTAFLGSDYIVGRELPLLLLKAKVEGFKILPILVSPVSPTLLGRIGNYQFLNWDKPLSQLSPEELTEELFKVAEAVKASVSIPRTCFLLTPFKEDYQAIRSFIADVLREFNVRPILMEESPATAATIFEYVQEQITNADFVIADVTDNNPSVMYELGMAHALKKPTLILVQDRNKMLPFDVRSQLFIAYRSQNPKDLAELRHVLSVWIPRLISQSEKGQN